FRVSRISPDGGKPSNVIDPSKMRLRFSDVLPDGKSFLATSEAGIAGDYLDIVLVNPDTLESKVLVRQGYGARYVSPGYIGFARSGNLMAVAFDSTRKE